jgi:transposase
MAMGPEKDRASTFQHEIVCLDELVDDDDRYRQLDRLIDWSFIRAAAEPYYASGGRPSVDPIVLVKLMLVGALEGTRSIREVLRQAKVRLDLRRFLGYGLGERLPVHQTLSMALTRRFIDGQLFERLFSRSVALCAQHGLLDGTHISVDGFHLEADAALSSLRASLGPIAPDRPDEAGAGADRPAPPDAAPTHDPAQLTLAPPPRRGAPTPPRRSTNQTARSRTDPDAALRHKPGQRPHLVYRGQVAVDPKRRVVVACQAERATGFEGDGLLAILDRARFVMRDLRSVAADQGYAAERVWRDLDRRRLRAYIPPPGYMLPPDGHAQTPVQERALRARADIKSAEGVWAYARRQADAEGAIAEAKIHGNLDRARCRGLSLFQVQLLIGCAAINCKRLVRHAQPHEGQAAAPGKRVQRVDQRARADACAVGAPSEKALTLTYWLSLN